MDVVDAVRNRRSVRSYQDRSVPPEKLERILEAARMAPSASNKQDWRFVVVIENRAKDRIYEVAKKQRFIKEAPVVVAGVTTDPGYIMTCGVPSGYVDVSIALDHISLLATEEGLGTCWIGAFDQEEVCSILEIPDDYEVVALMTLGYPEKPLESISKSRKSLQDVVDYEVFGGSR